MENIAGALADGAYKMTEFQACGQKRARTEDHATGRSIVLSKYVEHLLTIDEGVQSK